MLFTIMKLYFFILPLAVYLSYFASAQAPLQHDTPAADYEMLYPVFENGLYGFIDSSGKVRIKPQFENYGDFNEGLAPVRKDGRYGYINTQGNFVIQPIYDYANPFLCGAAVVMVKGVSKHIDKQGRDLYKSGFTSVADYHDNIAVAKTAKGKLLIDKQGKILTKEYDEVSVLWNGYILANSKISTTGSNKIKYYLMDKQYKVIYECIVENYNSIWLFADCLVTQTKAYADDYVRFSYADRGVTRFTSELYFEGQQNIDDALVAWEPVKDGETTVYNAYLISTTGTVIAKYNNARVESMGEGRYVVKNGKVTYMINGKGEKIRDSFTYLDNAFSNGRIVVKVSDKYVVMDTNGILYHGINATQLIQEGNYAVTSKPKGNNSYPEWKGVASLFDSSLSVPPVYDNVNLSYADKGMFILYKGEQLLYANRNGVVVWKEDTTLKTTNDYIDVDYMMRTSYYAYGKDTEESIGGHAESANGPKRINRPELRGGVRLLVARNEEHKAEKGSYWQNHVVFNLYMANDGDTALIFDAQDSRLYVVMQAKDEKGEWKDIEYSPSSWCGNSYHEMILPKGHYWKFEAPIYKGALKTKLRFKLDIRSENQYKGQKAQTIYSNEFEGSLNPAQFWRKQGYTPSGLMDPYSD